ncbi:MAG: D-alanyl-D-alanine carboxypeptidase family protein [Chthoniobacteraceae bacterium]
MAKFSIHNALAIFSAVLLLGGAAPGATKKGASSKPAARKPVPAPTPAPPPLAPGELPLAAKSVILLDAKTGDVLYEKAPDEMQYPASATKILTALLVLEQGDLDRHVTIQPEDTKVEPSALEFKPGEEYTRRQLLFALLLKSANDVALALARDNAGNVTAFCEKMNRRAEELGAKGSHFTNPHGLHNPHHFTTARDLALIARFAMQQPLFREIVATPQIGMARGGEWVVLKNHNKLLAMLPGCIGVKTGYTYPAQQVLVSSAIRAGREAISVVMHSDKPGIWNDSKTLLEHAFEKLGVPATPATPSPAPIGSPPDVPATPALGK